MTASDPVAMAALRKATRPSLPSFDQSERRTVVAYCRVRAKDPHCEPVTPDLLIIQVPLCWALLTFSRVLIPTAMC